MPPDHYLGPVGTVLAVALLWFREQGTDVHVLECGRGALADDVNVIENRWSVLTPVMLEHPNNLGPTLLDIAANKMAVIKSGQELCVSYSQDAQVEKLLKSLCRHLAVPLKLAGRDFSVGLASGLIVPVLCINPPPPKYLCALPGKFHSATRWPWLWWMCPASTTANCRPD